MFRFPYVSLDIETTGTDLDRAHVLQLAAVYDNGDLLDNLPTFNVTIRWEELGYINEWAMKNNQWLLKRGWDKDDVVDIEIADVKLQEWLNTVQPEGRITLAGKNIGSFDLPILGNHVNDFNTRRFLHRVLDPGSMYSDEFDHVPNLSEINKLTGRSQVSHDALDDAWDVVFAIRRKWNV